LPEVAVPERERDPAAVAAAGKSIADRIKSGARASGQDTEFLFKRFALERLLVRLNASRHAGAWCLKGGMVMLTLGAQSSRPTEDMDFTAFEPFDREGILATFTEVARIAPDVEDGLTFRLDEGACKEVREGSVNPGLRIAIDARLHTGGAPVPIRVKIDAGYGDPINPDARIARLPATCKGFEPPAIPMYPWETVVAEKLHGIQQHGIWNSRIKDYYDLVVISRGVRFSGRELASAVQATYLMRRARSVNPSPAGMSEAFAHEEHERAWRKFSFAKGIGTIIPTLAEALAEVRAFAQPLLAAVSEGRPMDADWIPGLGWDANEPKPEICAPPRA
jgi:predicted nucleotidyltransferase component of viral defense system